METCPKCGKELKKMYESHLRFCPIKMKTEFYGVFGDRKMKKEKLPESGCGSVFQLPVVGLIIPERELCAIHSEKND